MTAGLTGRIEAGFTGRDDATNTLQVEGYHIKGGKGGHQFNENSDEYLIEGIMKLKRSFESSKKTEKVKYYKIFGLIRCFTI